MTKYFAENQTIISVDQSPIFSLIGKTKSFFNQPKACALKNRVLYLNENFEFELFEKNGLYLGVETQRGSYSEWIESVDVFDVLIKFPYLLNDQSFIQFMVKNNSLDVGHVLIASTEASPCLKSLELIMFDCKKLTDEGEPSHTKKCINKIIYIDCSLIVEDFIYFDDKASWVIVLKSKNNDFYTIDSTCSDKLKSYAAQESDSGLAKQAAIDLGLLSIGKESKPEKKFETHTISHQNVHADQQPNYTFKYENDEAQGKVHVHGTLVLEKLHGGYWFGLHESLCKKALIFVIRIMKEGNCVGFNHRIFSDLRQDMPSGLIEEIDEIWLSMLSAYIGSKGFDVGSTVVGLRSLDQLKPENYTLLDGFDKTYVCGKLLASFTHQGKAAAIYSGGLSTPSDDLIYSINYGRKNVHRITYSIGAALEGIVTKNMGAEKSARFDEFIKTLEKRNHVTIKSF